MKKVSNGGGDSSKLSSSAGGSNKNLEIKYTKHHRDANGGGRKQISTTHQETMADPTTDVLAASR